MFARFRQRSLELEHLDKGDYSAAEYEGCLVELRRVNRWLGDARALRKSLVSELENLDVENLSVVDIGAGSGELLRVIANWARLKGRGARLVGVELNQRSAKAILERSADLREIAAVRGDAFRLPFADRQFDYAICSLFTHHFRDADVVKILTELARVASRRIFVIDLHRKPVPYYFYTRIGKLFLHNRLVREDGALSILRSFIPAELEDLARRAELEAITVTRRFPYRLVLAAAARSPAAESKTLAST